MKETVEGFLASERVALPGSDMTGSWRATLYLCNFRTVTSDKRLGNEGKPVLGVRGADAEHPLRWDCGLSGSTKAPGPWGSWECLQVLEYCRSD